MRRLLIFLAFSAGAFAQPLPPQSPIQFVSVDPSGSCSTGASLRWNATSGNLWGCDAGTWTKLNGSGGGANPGGTTGQIQFNAGSSTFGGFTLSGDCTANTATGAITCTKINGSTPGGTCTNQVVTSINSSGVPTCTAVANAALANSAVTLNGVAVSLGGTGTLPTSSIAISSPASDIVCAKGSDTNVALLTITGGTNAAPIVFTVSTSPVTAGYTVGQSFVVAGVAPAGYNGTYTITAENSTTITASNGSTPGGAYSSGGTVHMPCNNSTDATVATAFVTSTSIPGGTFATNTEIHLDALVETWSVTSTATGCAYPAINYGATPITATPYPNFGACNQFELPSTNGSIVGLGNQGWLSFLVHSPAAGTLYAALLNVNAISGTPPVVVSTSSTANLTPTIMFATQGLKSGTYTSGGTISGTSTQTCTLTAFTLATNATATVALTGSNTIAGGTVLVITNTGQGSNSLTAPTSATLGNGTATCSGTAVVATVLGGAQGMAVRLLSLRAWQ